ncbi:MAG: tetratricopeptide (TPR) repeat protein [Planctomycetota bacterium]|jgi:tetratricopeptide (TPR) repeat protein
MLVASHAFPRLLTIACLCAPVLFAQNERRPESFQLAIGMQQRGLHEEAAKYLTKFVREHAGHALIAEGYYRLAQSHTELQQVDPAIKNFREALKRGGKKFALRTEAQYRLGNLLQGKGDNANALSCFSDLGSEIAGDHYLAAAATYAKGEVLRDLGKDEPAAKAFAAASKLAVGEQAGFLFPALYQGGFAWLRLQKFGDAAATFTAAQLAAPDQAAKGECLYLIGDAQLRLQQYAKADRAFQSSLRIAGDYQDDAQYGLGWSALGRDDAQAAVDAFGKLIEDHPKSPFLDAARLERSRCFYQAQQFDDALQELKPLLKNGNELQQDARELQGLCALASGKGQSAVTSLQQALAKASDEDKPRLQFALGEAFANLNRWQEALKAYRSVPTGAAIELRGDAMYGACHALHELGNHKASIATAEQVIKIQPPHRSRVLAQLAVAENQFALRQFAAAAKVYSVLHAHAEHKALAAWKLSWCTYLVGDKAGAAKRFAAIAQVKDNTNAEEAMAMQALALYEAGERDTALSVSDRYRVRYRDGKFLDRTERIASRVLRQRGDLGAAQRRLERAAAIASKRGGAEAANSDVAEQADLAYQQGDYETADALFAKLGNKQDAIGARALAGRAWCAFELGDDELCGRVLANAKRHPGGADELAGLLELESALCHRMKAWPKAVAAARQFLKQFAKHEKAPMLQYALGVALARGGDQKAARTVLSALVQNGGYAEPDRVLYELAWAARRDGDEQAALASFRKVAISSKDVELAGESSLFIGTALLAGKQPNLQEASQWLLRVDGGHRKQALYRLGFAKFEASGTTKDANAKKQLLGKARDHFTAMAAIDGEELLGEALYLGAESCRRLGDYPGAVKRGKRLLREMPQHERAPRARLVCGESSLLSGQANDAIAPLEQFLREHNANKDDVARADAARANLWLGKARLQQRQYPAAEKCFIKVTELSEGALAAEAQFRLGESRMQRKDLNGAADAFLKLPVLYGDANWVRRGLLQAGLTYLQLNQPAKAKTFFTELVDEHKGSDEAKSAATHLQNR